jgi:hypothetical protein
VRERGRRCSYALKIKGINALVNLEVVPWTGGGGRNLAPLLRKRAQGARSPRPSVSPRMGRTAHPPVYFSPRITRTSDTYAITA